MKIHKRLKKIITSTLAALSLSLSYAPFMPMMSVSASSALVPVTGVQTGDLLVGLGVMEKGDNDLFFMSPLNRRLYTEDIFGNIVPKIKDNVGVTAEELAPLLGSVIPEDLYLSDGINFFVGNKQVTASDLYLKATSLVGVNYKMPVNVMGAQEYVGQPSNVSSDYHWAVCKMSSDYVGKDIYFVPYFVMEHNMQFIFPTAIMFPTSHSSLSYNYLTKFTQSYDLQCSLGSLLYYPVVMNEGYVTQDELVTYNLRTISEDFHDDFVCVTGFGTFDWANVTSTTCLVTKGMPTVELQGDKTELGNAVVKVEDDDNNGSTPPSPKSPNSWEIWQTVTELIDQIDNDIVTNGGTTYEQYVNNNYNYVNVDINVPDQIDTNINFHGDVTIHEDLPSVSGADGSGFFDVDAVDAIAALTTDNPIVPLVEGLFEVIDPILFGIYSVGVSLLIVLSLWKFIRG